MKTKKNKKFYNFTEYQKRRDRNRKMPRFWLGSVPSWHRRMHNGFRKSESKHILQQILKGKEVEFVPEKRTIQWEWW